MKKLFFSWFLAFLLVSSGAIAQKTTDLSAKIPVSPDIKIGTLDNGLKYYIKYNQKPKNKVELRLAVNAGAILEDDSQQGLAHFMEHMNFNGLEHFPNNELVHYLQSIGVAFGNDLNAYTGFDETVYILPVPSDDPEKLEKAFTVIADWSGSALLTSDEIEKERGVILAESRLGKGADDRMMKKWLPAMFNSSKYGSRLPIGKDSIISGFDQSVLKQFYADWYRPSLQAVIVVGDMPVADAEKMIIEKLGKYKNPANPRQRPETFEVKPFAKNRAMVLSDEEADRISISISGSSHPRTPITTVGDYRDKVIEGLCFSMLSARFEELKNSATPPFVYAYAYVGGGWARGYESYNGGAMCGINQLQQAVEALVTESMRVKKYGFTADELTRAKASILSDYEKQYKERDKTESGRLTYELVSNFFEKDAIPGIEWEYNYVKDNIDGISLKDFDAIRAKIDIDDTFFAFVTAKTQPNLPTDDQLKSWIETSLKQPVQPYKETKVASSLLDKEPVAGKIIRTTKNEKLGTTTYALSNKVTVCIKPTDFKNDEVLFKGSRYGGFSLYTGKDYQSAQFSNNVVEEMGYGNFSNSDLNKFLSGKIVNVSPTVVEYTEYISGNSSSKDLETMFQLLYLKCTSPRKDETAFKSYISRSKQQLESLKQNPQYLFMDSAYNVLYQGNPRAHLIESTSDYDKINIDNAIAYYNERIGNQSGMYYTFVGSFTEAQIVPLIEKYLAALPSANINTEIKDLGFYPKSGNNTFTLNKGSEQQAMLIHYISGKMPFNPDDNFMLGQLNEIINNKIIDTIREKMSAIYGGGCGGSMQKYPREEYLVQSGFPCSPDNIEKVHTAFMDLIESTKATGGITETDLNNVREPALEKNKVDLKENNYWLSVMQNAYLMGMDPERILTKEQRLKALTPAQMVETARKFYTNPSVLKAVWLPEKEK
jgi:zinc protease